MAEAARSRVTNAELYQEVLAMRKELGSFMAADGYGGRLLLAEKAIKDQTNAIIELDHTINGNGKTGMKADLQEVKHTVKIMLAILKWVMTPILGITLGIMANLMFGK